MIHIVNYTVCSIRNMAINQHMWDKIETLEMWMWRRCLEMPYTEHNTNLEVLQEHMQLKPNLYKIKEHFPGYELFSVPAYKDNSRINSGRPSGGTPIFKTATCPHPNVNQIIRDIANWKYVIKSYLTHATLSGY